MQRAKEKMGPCTREKLTRESFFSNTAGDKGNLSYIRECKKGTMTEDFEWRVERNKALLQAYLPRSTM